MLYTKVYKTNPGGLKMNRILSVEPTTASTKNPDSEKHEQDLVQLNQSNFKKLFESHIKTTSKKVPFSEIIVVCK
jgi:hypothetical protein